jgi:hypothetical protein
VPVEVFEGRMALMITSARQRILLLPSRIAPELEGLDGVQIKARLQVAIHQLLTVLSPGPRKLRRRRAAAVAHGQPTNRHHPSLPVGGT